jgi:polyhydroxyalkanoate synthesis regulator phasin
MAWTDAENRRVQEIEKGLSKHGTALGNVASKRQLHHMLTLLQKENAELNARIDALESQLTMLTNK